MKFIVGSMPVFNCLHQQIGLQVCQKSFADVVRSASLLSWTRDPLPVFLGLFFFCRDKCLEMAEVETPN